MRSLSNLPKLIFTTLLLALFSYLGSLYDKGDAVSEPAAPVIEHVNNEPSSSGILVNAKHILHGDASGGGHLYGTGKPCKSEFPEDWSADEIIAHVKAAAANDNAGWRQQDGGRYVAEPKIEGVKMRVVMNPARTRVISAYPLNTPRNPCRAANDNYND